MNCQRSRSSVSSFRYSTKTFDQFFIHLITSLFDPIQLYNSYRSYNAKQKWKSFYNFSFFSISFTNSMMVSFTVSSLHLERASHRSRIKQNVFLFYSQFLLFQKTQQQKLVTSSSRVKKKLCKFIDPDRNSFSMF